MPKKGYKQTEKHKENKAKFRRGRSWGHHTKELKERFRKERKGRPRPEITGNKHLNWKGGKIKRNGYILIYQPGHPNPHKRNPYIFEHRLVMEKHLERYLEKWEQIHHKNGRRDDNRLKNLELVVIKKHFGKVRCPYCLEEFLIK